jgi:hypothetical protein
MALTTKSTRFADTNFVPRHWQIGQRFALQRHGQLRDRSCTFPELQFIQIGVHTLLRKQLLVVPSLDNTTVSHNQYNISIFDS